MKKTKQNNSKGKKNAGLFALLKPYKWILLVLILVTFASNGLNLILPKIIADAIDAYTQSKFNFQAISLEFFGVSTFILVFMYLQSIVQTYAAERVARDIRHDLADKISAQSYEYIQNATPGRLLTNLTSDADAVKMFISMAVATMASSVFLIIGASILMLTIDWRLALAVLAIIPIIGGTFLLVLSKVRVLFKQTQGIIDWLNKVINESILGAAIIRVLDAQKEESQKFFEANSSAKDIGYRIVGYFSALIPVITFVANLATILILALGGHFVIQGTMTLGSFAAFNSYLVMLIFPIIMIGFMSNVVARASASYERIDDVLSTPKLVESGTIEKEISGHIQVEDLSISYGEKPVLKNASFEIQPKTKTAIIGPTAAGKTQILYLLTGLLKPDSGTIKFDDIKLEDYDKKTLHQQIGFVFQDSIIFNMTVGENIAFNNKVTEQDLGKAVETAEIADFIHKLPEGLDTVISERGTTLSGGQKQRVMLARALALNPKVLLLDEFTARVDRITEKKILDNVQKNYPDITLISVTQMIAPVEKYDQIILIMEGEVLAAGTHQQLMKKSPEYVQIYESQRSTNRYELQA